jgi:DNA-binding LacI/PurR family transcriptional regulator
MSDKDRIENSKRVTVKEVARRAGVSTATVSRAFNRDPRVLDETRKRVMEAARELDYRFNDAARSLKTRKTRTIGLVIPHLQNEFFMEVAEGVEACLKRHGYHLIVSNAADSPQNEREAVELLQEKSVDGLLIIPCREESARLGEVLRPDIPAVTIDRKYRDLQLPSVLADNYRGAWEATHTLIELSRPARPPAFIGGYAYITTAEERYRGYLQAIADSGYDEDPGRVFRDEFDKASGGYRAMERLIERLERPLSIFIANYFTHIGATEYLLEHEVSFADVHIAAFDYSPMYPLLRYCNRFVSQPRLKMGEVAVEQLMMLIDGRTTPPERMELRLNTELIEI